MNTVDGKAEYKGAVVSDVHTFLELRPLSGRKSILSVLLVLRR